MIRPIAIATTALFLYSCAGTQSVASTEVAPAPNSTRAATPAQAESFMAGPAAWNASDTVLLVHTLEEAKAMAAAGDKHILMVFAGSDWCAPCKQFKRSVLEEAGFSKGQKDKFVVLYLDFPSKKRNQLSADQKAYNDGLAARYNKEGQFPRIYLLKADGSTVKEMKYTGQTADVFVRELKAAG